MLVKKTIGKRKIVVLELILGLIFVLILYFLFSNYFIDQSTKLMTQKFGSIKLIPKIDTEFSLDFLQKWPYSELRLYTQLPVYVSPSEIGVTNPFFEINYSTGE